MSAAQPPGGKRQMVRYQEVENLSLDELREAFLTGPNQPYVNQSDLLAEIDRRRTREQADRMVKAAETTRRLTWAIAILTGVVAIATIVLLLRP